MTPQSSIAVGTADLAPIRRLAADLAPAFGIAVGATLGALIWAALIGFFLSL